MKKYFSTFANRFEYLPTSPVDSFGLATDSDYRSSNSAVSEIDLSCSALFVISSSTASRLSASSGGLVQLRVQVTREESETDDEDEHGGVVLRGGHHGRRRVGVPHSEGRPREQREALDDDI